MSLMAEEHETEAPITFTYNLKVNICLIAIDFNEKERLKFSSKHFQASKVPFNKIGFFAIYEAK